MRYAENAKASRIVFHGHHPIFDDFVYKMCDDV